MAETVRCARCGKEFRVTPSRIKRNTSGVFYCSMECRQKRTTLKCSQCSKTFERVNCQINDGPNFCSHACSVAYPRTREKKGAEHRCGGCNKKIYRAPFESPLTRKSGLVFCSSRCYWDWRKTQTPPHGDVNNNYRRRAFRAHGAECSNPDCPIKAAGIHIPRAMLDVHHKDGNRDNDAIENLEVLCVWCHAEKTRIKDE